MSCVLLLLAPDREADDAITVALDATAQTETALHVTYIIDPEVTERVHRTVGRKGWVGETACGELCASIQDAYEQRGRELLEAVETAARKQGRPCTTRVVTGPFVETALEVIAAVDAERAVVARRPGYRLRQLVRSSDVDAITKAAACPVVVVEPASTSSRPEP